MAGCASHRPNPESAATGDSLLLLPLLLQRARQPLVFVVVGLLNTAFGYGVFVLGIIMGAAPLLSLLAATALGVTFNFFTTGGIVFRNSDPRRFGLFVLGYAAVYGVNAGLLHALGWAGLGPVAAQAICVVPVACFAFAVMKLLVFGRAPNRNAVTGRDKS